MPHMGNIMHKLIMQCIFKLAGCQCAEQDPWTKAAVNPRKEGMPVPPMAALVKGAGFRAPISSPFTGAHPRCNSSLSKT